MENLSSYRVLKRPPLGSAQLRFGQNTNLASLLVDVDARWSMAGPRASRSSGRPDSELMLRTTRRETSWHGGCPSVIFGGERSHAYALVPSLPLAPSGLTLARQTRMLNVRPSARFLTVSRSQRMMTRGQKAIAAPTPSSPGQREQAQCQRGESPKGEKFPRGAYVSPGRAIAVTAPSPWTTAPSRSHDRMVDAERVATEREVLASDISRT